MSRKPEEIDAEDCGEVVERAAAIDVAKYYSAGFSQRD